jgi:hypothetical protein
MYLIYLILVIYKIDGSDVMYHYKIVSVPSKKQGDSVSAANPRCSLGRRNCKGGTGYYKKNRVFEHRFWGWLQIRPEWLKAIN